MDHTSPAVGTAAQPFDEVLRDLQKFVDDQIRAKDLKWYKDHATWPGRYFVLSGVLLITLSVTLPFIINLTFKEKDLVVSALSLAIAGLSSLAGFFQWQGQWQHFRQTQFLIEYLLSKWELDVIQARHHPDAAQAVGMLFEATNRLVDKVREATASETATFFQGVKLPGGK